MGGCVAPSSRTVEGARRLGLKHLALSAPSRSKVFAWHRRHGQWALPATLTMPVGPGPAPAVVLVHGSGPGDRDATVGRIKQFLRGLTVKDESVDDALAAVQVLRSTRGVDPNRIVSRWKPTIWASVHRFFVRSSLGRTLNRNATQKWGTSASRKQRSYHRPGHRRGSTAGATTSDLTPSPAKLEKL